MMLALFLLKYNKILNITYEKNSSYSCIGYD